jgi:hypothetical protein
VAPKIDANLASIDGNANILVELAGALGAGRPDYDLARKGCQEGLPDVSREIRAFADFGTDQYLDIVALLGALSSKLKGAGQVLGQTDQANADRFLADSTYVAPEQR